MCRLLIYGVQFLPHHSSSKANPSPRQCPTSVSTTATESDIANPNHTVRAESRIRQLALLLHTCPLRIMPLWLNTLTISNGRYISISIFVSAPFCFLLPSFLSIKRSMIPHAGIKRKRIQPPRKTLGAICSLYT